MRSPSRTPTPAVRAREHVARARAFLERNEPASAAGELERALAHDPANGEARALLAQAQHVMDEVTQKTNLAAPAISEPAGDVAPEDDWFAEEITNPESAAETAARVRRAEEEAAALEQPVSPPESARDPKDEARARTRTPAMVPHAHEAAPRAPVREVTTRPVGSPVPAAPPPRRARQATPRRASTLPVGVPKAASAAPEARWTTLLAQVEAELAQGAAAAAAQTADDALTALDGVADSARDRLLLTAREVLERAFLAHIGPLHATAIPVGRVPDMASRPLDHRAGFLLSRMDGALTIEGLIDIAGMSRFETLRTLSTLLRAGLVQLVPAHPAA